MMKNRLIIAGGVFIALIVVAALLSKKDRPDLTQAGAVQEEDASSAGELAKAAEVFEEQGDLLKARDAYRSIITEHPDYSQIENVQSRLEEVNMEIIFSQRQTPRTALHVVESGDTLGKIAKKYNTTVELIKKSNGLKSDVIRVGDRLRIWQGVFSVLVDKSQNKLILKSDDEVVKVYDVSTGKENNTPVGTFTIVNKLVDPVWYKSGAIVPPESPKNALGSRWLGFDIPGYGIHGTIEPETIGSQVTEGCVRMFNADVEELYSLLPAGTQVVVVD